jgi:hypothetical protein
MLFFEIALAVLWLTALVRIPTLWRDRRQRTLWGSVLALALTKTAAFPPVAARLHLPVLPHFFGVVAAFCLLRFISLVTGGGRRGGQFAITAGVLAALVTLDVVAGGVDTTAEVLSGPLTPVEVGYWVVLEAYLGAVLVTATVLFWTVGGAAPAGLPRLGLRAITAGSFVIALYAALKSILIVLHGFGAPVRFDRIEPAAHVVQTAAVLLAVAGGTVPASQRARAVASAYRSLLVLRPLWRAMRDAFPEVILFSPRRALIELAGVDDVHLRLYRRVIEIRDGMLALRDFVPERVPPADDPAGGEPPADDLAGGERAGGELAGGELAGGDPAAIEARAIASALRRRAQGVPPAEHPAGWAPVGPDMADEVAWLSRVSAAYRNAGAGRLSPDAAPTPRPSGSAR